MSLTKDRVPLRQYRDDENASARMAWKHIRAEAFRSAA